MILCLQKNSKKRPDMIEILKYPLFKMNVKPAENDIGMSDLIQE